MSKGECVNNEEVIKPIEKKDNTIYMSLKKEEDEYKMCKENGKIFSEIDDEFIDNIVIKGCEEK